MIPSAIVGVALVPTLYLGLAYSRGQTLPLPWMPRWLVPRFEAVTIGPPATTSLVLPVLVRVVEPSRVIQAKAGKLK
jgi:hypothetical protein